MLIFLGLHASLPMKIYRVIIFKVFSPLMREILQAWRMFFIDVGDFTCLTGREGEIVSSREISSQCGRVGTGSWKPCIHNQASVIHERSPF